jgi:hypothetical protein
MNGRLLIGVVVVALILSVVALSFIVQDEPGVSARAGFDLDVDVSASPALTR